MRLASLTRSDRRRLGIPSGPDSPSEVRTDVIRQLRERADGQVIRDSRRLPVPQLKARTSSTRLASTSSSIASNCLAEATVPQGRRPKGSPSGPVVLAMLGASGLQEDPVRHGALVDLYRLVGSKASSMRWVNRAGRRTFGAPPLAPRWFLPRTSRPPVCGWAFLDRLVADGFQEELSRRQSASS